MKVWRRRKGQLADDSGEGKQHKKGDTFEAVLKSLARPNIVLTGMSNWGNLRTYSPP